jgi:hypothetical protein
MAAVPPTVRLDAPVTPSKLVAGTPALGSTTVLPVRPKKVDSDVILKLGAPGLAMAPET